jgi:hypothetical protein
MEDDEIGAGIKDDCGQLLLDGVEAGYLARLAGGEIGEGALPARGNFVFGSLVRLGQRSRGKQSEKRGGWEDSHKQP